MDHYHKYLLMILCVMLSISIFVLPLSSFDIQYQRFDSNIPGSYLHIFFTDDYSITNSGYIMQSFTSTQSNNQTYVGGTYSIKPTASVGRTIDKISLHALETAPVKPTIYIDPVYYFSEDYIGKITIVVPEYPVIRMGSSTNLLSNTIVSKNFDLSNFSVFYDDASNPAGVTTRQVPSSDLSFAYYSAFGCLITINTDISVYKGGRIWIRASYDNPYDLPFGYTLTSDRTYITYLLGVYNDVIASYPDMSTDDIISSIEDASGDIQTAIDKLDADVVASLGGIQDTLDDMASADSEYYYEMLNPSESNQSTVDSDRSALESQKDALESIDDALKAPDIPDVPVTMPPISDVSGVSKIMSAFTSGSIIPTVLTFAASLIIISLLFFGL